MNKKGFTREKVLLTLAALCFLFALMFCFSRTKSEPLRYMASEGSAEFSSEEEKLIPVEKKRIVTHIKTPGAVKAVYMSSWVAGSPEVRERILKILDETEINAVVIDVKDSTGMVSFDMEDPIVKKMGAIEKRIGDIAELIDLLHSKNVYIIARIACFQDDFLANKRPDLAPFSKSTGKVWADRKGISWVEPGSEEIWDYIIAVGREAYEVGFDELNFDYIRFPSDGNMSDIGYRFYDSTVTNRSEKLKDFFKYLSGYFKPMGVPISADLFGMTMTNTDDLNIGQVLENTLPYFDYIAPMVYPSHYPTGFHNYKNPASVPYEIVKFSMDEGVRRALAASSSPEKLRPWLQDFDLGATYTAEMVREQMKAAYDAGLTSWMLWDPANKYTPTALLKNDEVVKAN